MQENKCHLELINTGLWKIDKVLGKTLLQITIFNEEQSLSYVPFDVDIEQIIDLFLEAELRNDLFVFTNPKLGKNRPTESFKKIDRIQKTIDLRFNKIYEVFGSPNYKVKSNAS